MTAPDAYEYVVRQRITPMVNRYTVFAGHDGERGPVAFVQQKRLKLREEIIFFGDEQRQHPVFRVKARKVLDLGGKYDVIDENGQRIGIFGKAFKASLTRSTWVIFAPDETTELLRIAERSKGVAYFRRIWGFLPYIGDWPFPMKYHFDFTAPDGRVLGSYDKITRFRDHYRLALGQQIPADVRVFFALAVALDALQSR
jgi:hypothetical protein